MNRKNEDWNISCASDGHNGVASADSAPYNRGQVLRVLRLRRNLRSKILVDSSTPEVRNNTANKKYGGIPFTMERTSMDIPSVEAVTRAAKRKIPVVD